MYEKLQQQTVLGGNSVVVSHMKTKFDLVKWEALEIYSIQKSLNSWKKKVMSYREVWQQQF